MMLKLLAMLQDIVPDSSHLQYLNMLSLPFYMLWNEVRHRKNGHNGISTSIKETADRVKQTDDKLALLALQGAGIVVRIDGHEKRLGDMEGAFHEYRREIRMELREQAMRLFKLEGRMDK